MIWWLLSLLDNQNSNWLILELIERLLDMHLSVTVCRQAFRMVESSDCYFIFQASSMICSVLVECLVTSILCRMFSTKNTNTYNRTPLHQIISSWQFECSFWTSTSMNWLGWNIHVERVYVTVLSSWYQSRQVRFPCFHLTRHSTWQVRVLW